MRFSFSRKYKGRSGEIVTPEFNQKILVLLDVAFCYIHKAVWCVGQDSHVLGECSQAYRKVLLFDGWPLNALPITPGIDLTSYFSYVQPNPRGSH